MIDTENFRTKDIRAFLVNMVDFSAILCYTFIC